MEQTDKAEALLRDLGSAVLRLSDALHQPQNEFIRDAAILRFEFCFELSWKAIQSLARLEGQDCPSPRMAVSIAWRNRWLAEESVWLDILEERDLTSHTYHEPTAKEVFKSLPEYLPQFAALQAALRKRLQEINRENDQAKQQD